MVWVRTEHGGAQDVCVRWVAGKAEEEVRGAKDPLQGLGARRK